MPTPAHETVPPALSPPPPAPPTASLESVEMELSLGQREIDDLHFEAAIRETAEAVGGVLLFQMRIEDGAASRWVAAVAIGEDDTREIAVIDLPCGGGSVSVVPASESKLPIASIASAYAGLADCWGKAA